VKSSVLRGVTPCSPIVHRSFGGIFCLHLKRPGVNQVSGALCLLVALNCCVLHSPYLAMALSLAPQFVL
jgi:hypothetical protein